MSFPAREGAASRGPAHLTVVETSRLSADRARSARAADVPDPEPFAVEVHRHDDVTILQPRGELDLATAETLRTAFDAVVAETLSVAPDGMGNGARLVLDLRGLSFIDSTGLRLLVAVDQRAQREGFELTLLAPAAPVDKAIRLCGLDQILPFAAPADAVDAEAADRGSEASRDVS